MPPPGPGVRAESAWRSRRRPACVQPYGPFYRSSNYSGSQKSEFRSQNEDTSDGVSEPSQLLEYVSELLDVSSQAILDSEILTPDFCRPEHSSSGHPGRGNRGLPYWAAISRS